MESSIFRRKQWRLSIRVVLCVLIGGGFLLGHKLGGEDMFTGEMTGECVPLVQGIPHSFTWGYSCTQPADNAMPTVDDPTINGHVSPEAENRNQHKDAVEGLEEKGLEVGLSEGNVGLDKRGLDMGSEERGLETTPPNGMVEARGKGGVDGGAKVTPQQEENEEARKKTERHEVSQEDDVIEKGVSGLGFDGKTGGERRSDEEFACDRSSWMTDTCHLRGTVRIRTDSKEVEMFTREKTPLGAPMGVRPQPRKYDADMMAVRITEFRMVSKSLQELDPRGGPTCDHVSDVPGVVFSAGGWIGNAFHEFTDVIIPLFITTERYHRKIRLLVSDAPEAWVRKYGRFLEIFSEFPVVLLGRDEATWCFEELKLGLEIHGYLTVNPEMMPGGVGLARMSELYAQRLGMPVSANPGELTPKIDVENGLESSNGSMQRGASGRGIPLEEERCNLRLGIVVRKGSGRVIENHERVVRLAEEEGFEVEELSFTYESPSLEDVFRTIQGLDVLMGVHGAALTYFVFMRPGTTLIQVVPWGVRHVADVYDGAPARAHGLRYIAYEVEAAESSLIDQYKVDDPVMADPDSVWEAGWAEGDRLYLRQQNVRLREERIRGVFKETRRELLSERGDVTAITDEVSEHA